MLVSRPKIVSLIVCLCLLTATFLLITGLLTAFGIQPLRSGAFLLEGLETMGPAIFFLIGLVIGAIGWAVFHRWRGARRLAMLVFALIGFAAIPALSSAVADFRWLALVAEGLKVLTCMLVIFNLMQPDVVEYFQR
jgi:hypothetical protein